jgi:hypothetical protein
MATKAQIDAAMTHVIDLAVKAGQSVDEAARWRVWWMPTQSWALIRVDEVDPSQFEMIRTLGDTKGEALQSLNAMQWGIVLTHKR